MTDEVSTSASGAEFPVKYRWLQYAIEKVGLPLLFVAILIYGIGFALKWAATNVAEPLVKSHCDLVEEVIADGKRRDSWQAKLSASQDSIANSQLEISKNTAKSLEELHSLSVRTDEQHRAQNGSLEKIEKKLPN